MVVLSRVPAMSMYWPKVREVKTFLSRGKAKGGGGVSPLIYPEKLPHSDGMHADYHSLACIDDD